MKKYNIDRRFIFKIMRHIALAWIIIELDNPLVYIVCTAIWVLSMLFVIYTKLRYRNQGYPNTFYFPTKNDLFFKQTSLILGCMLCIGSTYCLFYVPQLYHLSIITLVGGLLCITNWLVYVPRGYIHIGKNDLSMFSYFYKVPIEVIDHIEITDHRLSVFTQSNNTARIYHLDLNEEWMKHIQNFIHSKLDQIPVQIKQTQIQPT